MGIRVHTSSERGTMPSDECICVAWTPNWLSCCQYWLCHPSRHCSHFWHDERAATTNREEIFVRKEKSEESCSGGVVSMMRPKTYFSDIFIQMCGSHANSMPVRPEFCMSEYCWLLFFCFLFRFVFGSCIYLLLMSCHDMHVRWNIRANVCNQLNVSVRLCGFCLHFFRIFATFRFICGENWNILTTNTTPSSSNRSVLHESKHSLSFIQTIETWKCIVCQWRRDCASSAVRIFVAYVYLFDRNHLNCI